LSNIIDGIKNAKVASMEEFQKLNGRKKLDKMLPLKEE